MSEAVLLIAGWKISTVHFEETKLWSGKLKQTAGENFADSQIPSFVELHRGAIVLVRVLQKESIFYERQQSRSFIFYDKITWRKFKLKGENYAYNKPIS